jgi:proteasome assembly chaperone (PAC2) family protein
MDQLKMHRETPKNLDTLIVGLGGWIDAGEAATSSIRNMIRRLPAVRLASIDPEEFFNFTESRPTSRITAEGAREIRWPTNDFFAWQRPEKDTGILLFRGVEPNLKWKTYAKLMLDLAEKCGVKRIISLGALLASMPHTRTPRVTGSSTDPDWQAALEDWGILRRSNYQGPTGFATALFDEAAKRGIPYMTLMGQAPHYIQAANNPAVTRALLTYVVQVLNIQLDFTRLDEAVATFKSRCDQVVANEDSMKSYVEQLEVEYDSGFTEDPQPIDDTLIPEDLVQELEDFLKSEREPEDS